MYPCSSAPAHLNSPCWVCDRSYGMRLQRAKQWFCCDFWWDSSWRGSTFSIPQDLVSFAVCIFVTRGEGRRLGHCVTAAGDTGTPQDERLGKSLECLTLMQDSWYSYSMGNMPLPTYITKIKQKQKNYLLGLWCFGCNFLSAIWLLRLWTISKQNIYA